MKNCSLETETLKRATLFGTLFFHGKVIEDAIFDNQPISNEETIENIFIAVQDISMRLDQFKELIDIPHANLDRLLKRLNLKSERNN